MVYLSSKFVYSQFEEVNNICFPKKKKRGQLYIYIFELKMSELENDTY